MCIRDSLKLVMFEQAIRILAEPPVGRPPRWLHVRDVPVCGAEHPQKRLRVHRAGADLDIERLLQRTPARGPELRQFENQALKGHRVKKTGRQSRRDSEMNGSSAALRA